jgi:hypothetical protein
VLRDPELDPADDLASFAEAHHAADGVGRHQRGAISSELVPVAELESSVQGLGREVATT